MIVESATPAVAAVYIRLVCLLVEMAGHGPCRPSIEVRGIARQGRLL